MALDFSALDDVSALIRGQDTGKGIRNVRVDAIQPDPNQPRKIFDEEAISELAESIRSVGIIQPPVARTHDGGYLLISGERRWRAARQLGWEKIDVIVRDDLQSRAQLVENIQREALSPWEIYRVISAELASGTTQADLARALGKSRAWVTAYAAIDKMPEPLVTALRERRITGVTDLSQMHRLVEEAPSVAKELLSSAGQISRSRIEKARKDVSTQRASAKLGTTPSQEPTETEGTEPVEIPRRRIAVRADSALGPQLKSTRGSLPVRIRVHYEGDCWIVDF
ncbi:MAG: ParB/RepB/Spo0J family partition protein, partial [Xanthomonadaceae bacterium]|nr:ParB/RepB/Spo0J family partition protein [Xanthomonadaceae bacterium]